MVARRFFLGQTFGVSSSLIWQSLQIHMLRGKFRFFLRLDRLLVEPKVRRFAVSNHSLGSQSGDLSPTTTFIALQRMSGLAILHSSLSSNW